MKLVLLKNISQKGIHLDIFNVCVVSWAPKHSRALKLHPSFWLFIQYLYRAARALDVIWKDHITNKELYGDLPKITTRISKRRIQFAGHCMPSEGILISELVAWRHVQGTRSARRPTKTLVDLLHELTGFITNETDTCMQNRDCGKPSLESVRRCWSEWVICTER